MEIAIAGEGELVIRYIDKDGRSLMQERLVVSGSPTMEARHLAPHTLQTTDGAAEVAAVLVRRSNARQRVTFDRQAQLTRAGAARRSAAPRRSRWRRRAVGHPSRSPASAPRRRPTTPPWCAWPPRPRAGDVADRGRPRAAVPQGVAPDAA
jgi:hypothetical protein